MLNMNLTEDYIIGFHNFTIKCIVMDFSSTKQCVAGMMQMFKHC